MDELEISGRRYISSARAAKEHKYHSDYIGQLVRGGKVEGQKVGRAWYVDAESLAEYLGKEVPPRGPVAAKIEKAMPAPKVEEVITIKSEEPKEVEVDDFLIPLRKPGRQHIIAAIDGSEPKELPKKKEFVPEIVKEIKAEPVITGYIEELVPEIEEVPIEAIEIENNAEETYIPVKITAKKIEPEDSFYKVSSKGLRYVPQGRTVAAPVQKQKVIAALPVRVKLAAPGGVYKFATAVSLVLVAGIVSLGAGVLMSYYLHSTTTVQGGAQTSSVLLSN